MSEYIKISCTGDILCEGQQLKENYNMKEKKYDFYSNFNGIKNFLSKSDYVIGNIETPLTERYDNLTCEEYAFNTPIEFAEALKDVGIDMLTLANNHCLDRGIEGVEETIRCLDKLDIDHTGTYSRENTTDRVFIKQVRNMKFAIISYTYGTNRQINRVTLNKNNIQCVNLFRNQEQIIHKYNILKRVKRKIFSNKIEDKFKHKRDLKYLLKVKEDITYGKNNADFVIFYMHSGGQYNPIPEDYTKKLMDYIYECGADIVIGMHPHVVHEIKEYTDKKIGIYSLGNLYAQPYVNNNQKDNLPNYSIIFNMYFDEKEKKLVKTTFSIAKSDMENGKVYVKMVNDIINSQMDLREETSIESKKIAEIFLKSQIENIEEEMPVGGNFEKK